MGELQRCRFLRSVVLLYDPETQTAIVNNAVLEVTPTQFRVLHLLVEKERVTYEEFSQVLFGRKLDTYSKRKIIQTISEVRSLLGWRGVEVSNMRYWGYILQDAT